MEEYRDDDEADRRSINSVATSARMPLGSDRAIMDAAISPDLPYSKSPFAASQLFSSNPDDTLGAIEEGVQARWGGDDDGRPHSPDLDEDSIYDKRPTTSVPFRRPMEDDSKPEAPPSRRESEQGSPDLDADTVPPSPRADEPSESSTRRPRLGHRQSERRRRVEFPRSDTMSSDGDVRAPLSGVDANQPLIGLRTRLSSRASQGGLTSLIDAEKSEGLWRARSNSFV
jgi:1-phosphatidylinositol-3-phosphate 5-kinase